ncbi:hypothetical protein ACP70R_006644 [Stipagrostis hirtigluma subsp. patula]
MESTDDQPWVAGRAVRGAMDLSAMPDDLLELILLHVDNPIWLIRSACTCTRWHRIVADAAFLGRFRSIHGPPIAGVYRNGKSYSRPSFLPSPSSGIVCRYSSLDFLPDNGTSSWVWRLKDSRGSLILLERRDYGQRRDGRCNDMIVCEPLTRRYKIIAPMIQFDGFRHAEAFLLGDILRADGFGMSNFRVICMVNANGSYQAGVFTPGSSWRDISVGRIDIIGLTTSYLYWYTGGRTVVVVDRSTFRFSSFVLPDIEDWDHHGSRYKMTVTLGRDGRERIVVSGADSNIKVFARVQGGGAGAGEWALEKSIQPAAATSTLLKSEHCTIGWPKCSSLHRDGTVLIGGIRRLDLDTEAVEIEHTPASVYPCELPWLPALRACTDHCDQAT